MWGKPQSYPIQIPHLKEDRDAYVPHENLEPLNCTTRKSINLNDSDTYCPHTLSEMFVSVDGSVYICCDTWEVVGNIREQSPNDIFNSAYPNEIREKTPVS